MFVNIIGLMFIQNINKHSSSVPLFYGTPVIVINNNSGRNAYTCGMINYGFGQGTLVDGRGNRNDIDLSTSYGTCFVEGGSWGTLRKFKITSCMSVPLDDHIPIIFIVFAIGSLFFFRRVELSPSS